MREFKPAMVFSLAEYLSEEMEARGWNAVDVAQRMPGDYGINVGVVNIILALGSEKEFALGDGVATGLAEAFGVSEQFIANLHKSWIDNPKARQPFTCPEHLFAGLEFPKPTPDPATDARSSDG